MQMAFTLAFQQKKFPMSKFMQHAFLTTGTRVLLMSMSFLQGVIIARYLLPEGRGFIAVYLAIVNMLLPFSELGIKQSSAYFLNKRKIPLSEIVNIQSITLIFSSVLTWLILLIIFSFQDLVNTFVLIMIFLSIPFRIYISFSTGIALANRKINTINIVQLLLTFVDIFLVVILFILLKLEAEYYFIAYFISSFIAGIYIFFWLDKTYQVTFTFDFQSYKEKALPIIKKGITYALPLFVIGLNYSLDILILNSYVDNTEIGIYSVGVTLAVLLWQLPSILNLLIFSYSVSTKDENKFSLNLWNKSKIIMLIMLPIVGIITLVSKYVIPIIYGDEFARSFDVLMWLMPGVYMMVAFKLLNGDLAARGNPMIAFYVFSFAVIVNVILNIALIPSIGINGAAVASTISYSVAAVIFVYIYFKKFIFIEEKQ